MSLFQDLYTVGSHPVQHAGTVDTGQLRRALEVFLDPNHHVFIQSLPSANWRGFMGSEHNAIEEWVCSVSAEARGMYFGINPTVPLHKPSLVGDVVYRRWIYIDVDRNKTLQPNDPATEKEHDDAKQLAWEIKSYLSDVGFPLPVEVDSGNGCHLYYRINFPNDVEHRKLVHDFLKILDNTFSDERGNVDHDCFDARRISRLPGTWSRRGVASHERHYRQCKFIYQPKIEEVPVELLRKIVGKEIVIGTTEQPKTQQPTIYQMNVETDEEKRTTAYAQAAVREECAKLAATPPGERNNQLFKTAAALYELVAAKFITEQEVLSAIWIAAYQCKMQDDVDGEKGITSTIESGKTHGMLHPRKLPENQKSGKADHEQTQIDPNERLIILASEITPCKIQWLWQGRIPLSTMTTFAGSTGLGKTTVLTDIVARVTTGSSWPDGTSGNTPGRVLYITGEDAPDSILVPRLIAAGGDRTKVAYLKPLVLGKFSLKCIDIFEKALDQLGDNCMLICIDPPTSFLAGVNDHKNSELRGLLTPLSELAIRRRVSIVFITHINKGGANTEAVMRIIGSVAWAAAARAAYVFAPDPDDQERSIFIGVKVNGAKKRKGLYYKIESADPNELDGPSKIVWLGDVDITANEAMQGQVQTKKRGECAADWLIEKFREKLEWDSDDLFKEAKNHGVSRNAVFEAKKLLELPTARRIVHLGGNVSYQWWVPEDWPRFLPEPEKGSAAPKPKNTGTPGHQDEKTTQGLDF